MFIKMMGHTTFQGEIIKNYQKFVGIFKKIIKNHLARKDETYLEASPGTVDLSLLKSWGWGGGMNYYIGI